MDKILFLDIDGVLNSRPFLHAAADEQFESHTRGAEQNEAELLES